MSYVPAPFRNHLLIIKMENIAMPRPLLAAATAGLIAMTLMTLGSPAFGIDKQPKQVALSCKIGPVTRTYGNSTWLVYSCDDDHSIVAISAPDSPAAPFYFMLWWNGSFHQIQAEGTGNRTATDSAFADIQKLNASDIAALRDDILRGEATR